MKKKNSHRLLTLLLVCAHSMASSDHLVRSNIRPSHHVAVEGQREMFSLYFPIFVFCSGAVNATCYSHLTWRTCPTAGSTGEDGLNFFQFVINIFHLGLWVNNSTSVF